MVNKFIRKRIVELKQSQAAGSVIRRKARVAYLQEKEKQAIVYARQKAILERQRKVEKLKARPMFYREAYKAAGRLGRGIEVRRAYSESPRKGKIPPQFLKKKPKIRRIRRRSYASESGQFYDSGMYGGF